MFGISPQLRISFQHSPLAGCVPAARLENPSPNVSGAAADCQVSAFYIYNEHRQYISHRRHHQLELQVCTTNTVGAAYSGKPLRVNDFQSPNEQIYNTETVGYTAAFSGQKWTAPTAHSNYSGRQFEWTCSVKSFLEESATTYMD